MSRSTCAFSIKLEKIRNLDIEEAKGYVQLFLEDLKLENGLNPKDEVPSDQLESYQLEEEIIKKAFNIGDGPKETNCCLLSVFWWLCFLFGTELDSLGDSLTIDTLWFKSSKLDGNYNPPFGFPPNDENIGHLTLEEIEEERKQLDGCLQETYEESSPEIVCMLSPQQLEEEKNEWNDLVLPARKDYLGWLDFCIREKTDLIIIET